MTKKTAEPSLFDQLCAARPRETVDLPEIGQTVQVRSLSYGEIMTAYKAASPDGTLENVDADALATQVVAMSCFDQRDERMIPEGREADFGALPGGVAQRLVAAAFRLNGLSQAEGAADA